MVNFKVSQNTGNLSQKRLFMPRRIDWNPEYKNADDQQNTFIDKYLSWSPIKKWEYLMELFSQGINNSAKKGKRRIEWK